MKHRVIIALPYFGKLPKYFQLWLNSCQYNPLFEWIIFTDDHTSQFSYPANVEIVNLQFRDFVGMLGNAADVRNLKSPYKICDYRPAFGVALSGYFSGYDFWGHCDADMIFGDISKFVNDRVLEQNYKIFKRGHLSLMRNIDKVNNLFKEENLGSKIKFSDVTNTPRNLAFDESAGIYRYYEQLNYPVFLDEVTVDISSARFKMTFVGNTAYKNRSYQIFYWENGRVIHRYLDNEMTPNECEYAYIHFKRRPMSMAISSDSVSRYVIASDGFYPLPDLPFTTHDFLNINVDSRFHDYLIYTRRIKRKVIKTLSQAH